MKYMVAIPKGSGQTQSVSIAQISETCRVALKAQAAFQSLYLSITPSVEILMNKNRKKIG